MYCIIIIIIVALICFTGIRVHPSCSQGMILLTTTANGGGNFDICRGPLIVFLPNSPATLFSFLHRKSSGSCLSSFFTFIYQSIKTSVWLLVLILIILILLLVIIEVNTSIGRCSKGRMCSRSPLRLFLGQNLEYTHLGEVPT